MPADWITHLSVGVGGELWVGLKSGFYTRRDGHFEPRRERPGGPPLGDIGLDRASLPDGTQLLVRAGELWTFRNGALGAEIPVRPQPQRVVTRRDGTAWIGFSRDGVDRRDLDGTVTERVVPREDNVGALFVDREGALWVGGGGPGAQRLAPSGKLDEVLMPNGDRPTGVKAFAQLADGTMLVATENLGLVVVRDRAFHVLDGRSGGATQVMSVFQDRDGAVWVDGNDASALVARRGDGVRRFNRDLPALTHLVARDGTHYVGTAHGLLRVVGDVLEPVPVGPPAIIAALAEMPAGVLWVGNYNEALIRWDGREAKEVRRPGGAALTTSAILPSRDGDTLWVGTDRGLCKITGVGRGGGEAPVCFGDADGVPEALVIGLHEDDAGSVWAATYERGLVRVRDGRGVALTPAQGLPSDTVYTVLEDDAGRFWMPGPTGIVRASRADMDAVADGRAARFATRMFGVADGLPVAETTGGVMGASRAPDGRLWFSTPAGAVVVDPKQPDPVVRSPLAVIRELRVGARELPPAGGAAAPDERTVVVRYTAPTLDEPGAVRFRYRLDDVDEDWVDAGTRRVAMYTGLPAGRHRFRVAALAPGAVEFGPEASFSVDLEAAFAETLPFRLLVIAAALALLYALYRARVALILRREAALGRLVDQRTRQLAEATGALEAMNATLAERVEDAVAKLRGAERMAAYGQMVAGVAHEVRQPLFALGTTAYVLGDKLRDRPELQGEVKLIERETRRMNRVVEELLEFAKPAELARHPTSPATLLHDAVAIFRAEHDPEEKLAVTVDVEGAPEVIVVDADRVQQVLVNLMSNAKRHAAGLTRVALAARAEGAERVVIEVADDGAGIDAGALPRLFEPFFTTGGTGLGLPIARRIAEAHGGGIAVTSGPGGTTFRVTLPRVAPAAAAGGSDGGG